MNKKTLKILILMLFFGTVSLLEAQQTGYSFKGFITDVETLEPVASAKVTLTGPKLSTATDSTGFFGFIGLKKGVYTLEVEHVRYKSFSEKIDYTSEGNNTYNIRLIPISYRTPVIVIEEHHSESVFDNLLEMSGVLKDRELQRNLGVTLASTLKNESGLSIRSMGPAPSRPVFRGLSSDRVFISEDEIKTNDLSATSPDHAVTVEPFTVERVEIYRGPKVLLFTPTTIGGVVNTVKNEIPSALPSRLSLNCGIYGESSNNGYLYSLSGLLPYSGFVARGEVTGRKADDQNTPAGTLANSYINSLTLGAGLSWFGNWGYAGVSAKDYALDYGIPGGFIGAHPYGVNIRMTKRQYNARAHIHFENTAFKNLHFVFSRVYYNHREFEAANLVGAEFGITDYNGRFHTDHERIGFFSNGTMGLSFDYRDFKVGGYVFTPPSKSFNLSAFIYENIKASEKFSFEFSARANYDRIDPNPVNQFSSIGNIREKTFGTFSFSASGIYRVLPKLYAGINLSRSSRVPTIEELFSEGPHLAAYSYETGNPELESERGIGSELFAYYKSSDLYLMAALFVNTLPYYIIPRNSGRINYATLLPIYITEGTGALFYGTESQAELRLPLDMVFSASLGYTRGSFSSDGSPLPMIPPLKGTAELKFQKENLTLGIIAELAARQDRVDAFEQPTAGYSVLNLFGQYLFTTGKVIHNLSVNADNILNTEYRNHLSRVKSIIPEAGLSLRLTYRIYY